MGRTLWEYVSAIATAQDLVALQDLFAAAAAHLGFARVGLFSHVDPLRPGDRGVALSAGQDAWIAHYSRQGYQLVDPFQREARRRSTPFLLSEVSLDPADPVQTRMLDDMRAAGLHDGLAIPIRTPGELPAACVFFGAEALTPERYGLAHAAAVFTHAAACRLLAKKRGHAPTALTPRECSCLVWVARGKSDVEIAQLTSLSRRTVHHTIERAKRRLGVTTRVQAVVLALEQGLISFAEVAS